MSECFVRSGKLVEVRELDVLGRDVRYFNELCIILKQSFDLKADEVEASISNPNKQAYGYVEAGRLASIALVNVFDDIATITYLATEEGLRGKGLGSRLLGVVEDECRSRGAQVMSLICKDEARFDFYSRHGYDLIGSQGFQKDL